MVISGSLDLNGHHLYAGEDEESTPSNFSTSGSGILIMQHDADQLSVDGNVTFAGGSENGKLSTGLIKVGGDFTQHASSDGPYDTFAASQYHKVQFTAEVEHHISFSHAAPGADHSHFQELEILNSEGGTTVILDTEVAANGQLLTHSNSVTIQSDGRILRVKGLDVSGLNLDHVQLVSDGGTFTSFQSVYFKNYGEDDDYVTFYHPGFGGLIHFAYLDFTTYDNAELRSGHWLVVRDTLLDGNNIHIGLDHITPNPSSLIENTSVSEDNDGVNIFDENAA
jgi:hypothetical protein